MAKPAGRAVGRPASHAEAASRSGAANFAFPNLGFSLTGEKGEWMLGAEYLLADDKAYAPRSAPV